MSNQPAQVWWCYADHAEQGVYVAATGIDDATAKGATRLRRGVASITARYRVTSGDPMRTIAGLLAARRRESEAA